MPLTDAERAFLDHYAIEIQHRDVAPMWCLHQLRKRLIDRDEVTPLLLLRGEERWDDDDEYFCSSTFLTEPRFPPTPAPCPWTDAAAFRSRLRRLTRLCEENARRSRTFRFFPDGDGLFVNIALIVELGEEPSGTGWQYDLILGGWRFRCRAPGLVRGNLAPELRGVPASVWDREGLPFPMRRCGYLVVVEAEPEPFPVEGIPDHELRQLFTADDLAWYFAELREDDEEGDPTRFPPPP